MTPTIFAEMSLLFLLQIWASRNCSAKFALPKSIMFLNIVNQLTKYLEAPSVLLPYNCPNFCRKIYTWAKEERNMCTELYIIWYVCIAAIGILYTFSAQNWWMDLCVSIFECSSSPLLVKNEFLYSKIK